MNAMPPSHAIASLKRALRKEIRERLAQIDEASLTLQSRAVSQIVKTSTWYQSSKKLACYLSMTNGELRTDELVLDALTSGKEVYVPYCAITDPSKSEMRMIRLDSPSMFSSLVTNRWGIREYLPSQIMGLEEGLTQGLDLILMPGTVKTTPFINMALVEQRLAFDRSGGRLGHGRGYYDAYLSKLKARSALPIDDGHPAHKGPMLVGLALSEQILPAGVQVPTTEQDHSIDLLIGPTGAINPAASSALQS